LKGVFAGRFEPSPSEATIARAAELGATPGPRKVNSTAAKLGELTHLAAQSGSAVCRSRSLRRQIRNPAE
jgi:hypothetical protein